VKVTLLRLPTSAVTGDEGLEIQDPDPVVETVVQEAARLGARPPEVQHAAAA
jgi:hypothetical protein